MIARVMNLAGHHPATDQLARFQFAAKLRRIAERIRSPRRRWLVVLSIVLGCVWLGQSVAGIFLRAPADPARIRFWIPAAMSVYCLWHLIKTLTRSSEQPFDWTLAEEELLHGAPFSRQQLIFYRSRSILIAAIAKAACFAIVMIPDVPAIVTAFLGMLGGLVLVDCVRLWFEIAFDAMTNRERWLTRVGLLGPIFIIVGFAFYSCFAVVPDSVSPAYLSIVLAKQLSTTLLGLLESGPLSILVLPFQSFANIVFLENGSPQSFVVAALTSLIAICAVLVTDRWATNRKRRLEREAWHRATALASPSRTATVTEQQRGRWRTPAVWRLRLSGMAPIAGRQLLGAWHYRDAVAFALLVPTLLCCVPMFAEASNLWMLMNIVGSLVFYTFLLLPSGLILDFRRDIDRIAVLKSLPISPWALTVGQLTTPVLLASLFQSMVLGIGAALGTITVAQAVVSAILLLPFNVLNFSFENYLFMLSPYRRNEEGVLVFVRTILTFTGKGLIFAIAAALTVTWAIVANRFGPLLIEHPWTGSILFGAGIWLSVTATAILVTRQLSQRIANFDVTQDAPA